MATAPATPDPSTEAAGPATAAAIPLRSWQDGIGPAFISLFLLIVFFDQLGPYTLARGGLGASLAGAAAGGALAFALLYYAPAMSGLRARRDLAGIAGRTFGGSGARWVPGVVLALVQVAWFAVAIGYAAELSLTSLVMAGVIEPGKLDAPKPEAAPALGGPVFLSTLAIWMLAAAFLGPILVRIVSAILYAYAVIPALVFGGLMAWSLGGLRTYPTPAGVEGGAAPAFWAMVQIVFAYAATAGVLSADWGAASKSPRDVRLGGLVGVVLAPVIVASVALVTVAGALGRAAANAPEPLAAQATPRSLSAPPPPGPEDFVYHQAVLEDGVGGVLGCILTMVFCLALLGPACYAPTTFRQKLSEVMPGVPRWAWALVGVVLAWPLAATGLAARLPWVFGVVGAVMAPIAGAIAAGYARDPGRRAAPRRGFNLPGILGWLLGTCVGLLPYIGPSLGAAGLSRVQPAAVLAFAAAFLVRVLLGIFGMDSAEFEEEPTAD